MHCYCACVVNGSFTHTVPPLNSNFCPTPDESDADGDSVLDLCDNCENIFNVDQEDTDLDRVGDVCDNCPFLHNPAQLKNDGDSAGDLCDTDDDNDHISMFVQ